MSDELLDRATRALARETDAMSEHGEATLTCILDALEEAESKPVPLHRRAFVGWAAAAALALVVVMGGPTAWAWSVEVVRSLLVTSADVAAEPALAEPVSSASVPEPQPLRVEAAAEVTTAAVPLVPVPLSPPPAAPEPSQSAPPDAISLRAHAPSSRAPSSRAPSSRAPSSRANGASPAPSAPAVAALDPAVRAERELFETAHRLHFGSAGPAAALSAWDAYLSSHPAGRYAPEARYNRALTLVRLGRIDPARRALEDLSHGGYRWSEVRALLDATAP